MPYLKQKENKMNYTKGEWKAQRNSTGTWTIQTEEEHIGDIDRHFNAHLIAAAPCCYEELKAIVNDSERLGWSTFMSKIQDRIPQIKELLAKAEGE